MSKLVPLRIPENWVSLHDLIASFRYPMPWVASAAYSVFEYWGRMGRYEVIKEIRNGEFGLFLPNIEEEDCDWSEVDLSDLYDYGPRVQVESEGDWDLL